MTKKHKIGSREVAFNISTMMRIEQRTGKTTGEIVSYIHSASKKLRDAREDQATDDAGLVALAAMGDITLTTNFVGAAFNIPNEIVESDYGDKLLKIFGEMFEPYSSAYVSMTGQDAKSGGDDSGNAETAGSDESSQE